MMRIFYIWEKVNVRNGMFRKIDLEIACVRCSKSLKCNADSKFLLTIDFFTLWSTLYGWP